MLGLDRIDRTGTPKFGMMLGPRSMAADTWKSYPGSGGLSTLYQNVAGNRGAVGGIATGPQSMIFNPVSGARNDVMFSRDNVAQNQPLPVTMGWGQTTPITTFWTSGIFCVPIAPTAAWSANPWTMPGFYHDVGGGIWNLNVSLDAGNIVVTAYWWKGSSLVTPKTIIIQPRRWYEWESWKDGTSGTMYLRIGNTIVQVTDTVTNLVGTFTGASAVRFGVGNIYAPGADTGTHMAIASMLMAKSKPPADVRGVVRQEHARRLQNIEAGI